MIAKPLFMALTAAALLAACSDDEILKGERIDVRAPLPASTDRISGPELDEVVYANLLQRENIPLSINLPDMRGHPAWPQLNGGPANRIQHPALSLEPRRLWSVNIGAGNSSSQRITASPVAADGYIFAMDSQSRVTSHSLQGAPAWSVSLVPQYERREDAAGGGLAVADGVLYATTGFGELHALGAATGESLWVQKFSAPASYAPTVNGGLIYVVTQDGQAWAVEAETGRLRRNWQSVFGPASIASGSTPAAAGSTVIIPFPSGELQAANIESGSVIWSVIVGGARDTAARSSFRSITSAPVIDGGIVYAGNQAGRMAAVELKTGATRWTVSEGSYSPVWPAGGSVFVVSDAGELVRLDAASGQRIWGIPLPAHKSGGIGSGLFGGRKAVYANFGPVLAGGRIVVASGDGKIRFFDPVTGRLVNTVETRSGAAAAPIIVDGVLYMVDEDGDLTAYG